MRSLRRRASEASAREGGCSGASASASERKIRRLFGRERERSERKIRRLFGRERERSELKRRRLFGRLPHCSRPLRSHKRMRSLGRRCSRPLRAQTKEVARAPLPLALVVKQL
jgi:hypothetical protein